MKMFALLLLLFPNFLLIQPELNEDLAYKSNKKEVCSANTKKAEEPYMVKEFTVSGAGSLFVKTSGGSIDVNAKKGNDVRVEVYVKSSSWNPFSKSNNWTQEDIEEHYDIIVKKEGSSIHATAERKGKWTSGGLSISFKVTVPEKFTTELKTSGGSIQLSGVSGSQTANTSGGSISLASVSGNLNVRTSGGSINVDKLNGTLDAHTSGGPIRLKSAKGDMKLHTSGGGIHLEGISGSVDASTSGGSIDADITKLEKHLYLRTSGGSIHANIPGGLGLDLELRGNNVDTKLNNFSGESKKNSVVGKVNGGGIPIKLTTSGGSVNLDYKM